MPESIVGLALDPWKCFPFVKHGAEFVGSATPVVSGGNLFGLAGDTLFDLDGFFGFGGSLGLAFLALRFDRRGECIESLLERVEIPDGLGICEIRARLLDRFGGIVGGERPTFEALFEQPHFGLKSGEAFGVERDGLLSITVHPLGDHPFAFAGADIDIALVVDSTPWLGCFGVHGHQSMSKGVRVHPCASRNLCVVLIASFPAGPLQANCYFVSRNPGTKCVIVDPGMDAVDGIKDVVREHNVEPAAIFITHGHFDHMWTASEVAALYDVPVWIHPADRHLLSDPMAAISTESAGMLRAQLGMTDVPDFTEPDDVREAVGDAVIDIDGMAFTVDHVPGHTPGTVVYRVDYDGPEDVSQVMFSGDFLFEGSIGRTDLGGGDHSAMLNSLKTQVLPLPDDVIVLPGHGGQTSIGRERATNPFLAELTR